MPPKPIRQLRNLTRYRKTQIPEREREVNRLHKALEDAGIKLDCVAADILGKSGRDRLDALVAGESDPDVLADLARLRRPGSRERPSPWAIAPAEGRSRLRVATAPLGPLFNAAVSPAGPAVSTGKCRHWTRRVPR